MSPTAALTRRELLGGASAAAGALWLAGCGTGQRIPGQLTDAVRVSDDVPRPPATGGRPGGTLVVGWQQQGNSLDPALGYDLVSWDSLCNCTTAPPLTFGAQGQGPYPNAAESVTANADHSVYTVRFRDGVRFANGRRVTAEDYVYSWERVLDPKLASWASSYLLPIEGAEAVLKKRARTIAGVRRLDRMTLRIQLSAPDLTFANILAEPYMAAVDRAAVEQWGSAFAEHVVSTGPFTLTSYDASAETCAFTRNPHYFWRGLPYLDSVAYRWGTTAQTELLQLERGDIQSIGEGIGQSLVPEVLAESDLHRYVDTVELPAVSWIAFNCARHPFTDVRVRQALNYATDRPEITKVGYGSGVPWGLPFPKVLPDYHRIATPYTYQPERARSLLRAAGHDDLSFTLTTTSDDPNPSIAQILQQQLQAVGVKMAIDTVSDDAYNTATENKDFDAAPVHWYQVQPTALDILGSNWVSSGSANYYNFSDRKVDALATSALRARTTGESNADLARAEVLVAQGAPGIFLEALNFVDGRSPNLRNFHYNIFYGTYYDRVWLSA